MRKSGIKLCNPNIELYNISPCVNSYRLIYLESIVILKRYSCLKSNITKISFLSIQFWLNFVHLHSWILTYSWLKVYEIVRQWYIRIPFLKISFLQKRRTINHVHKILVKFFLSILHSWINTYSWLKVYDMYQLV